MEGLYTRKVRVRQRVSSLPKGKHNPMNPRCQALAALQASAERNFGLHANPATAGANKLYAGAKKDAV